MSDMGCHCLAVGWYALTPPGKPVDVSWSRSPCRPTCRCSSGDSPRWRQKLVERFGVDYAANAGRRLRHGHGDLQESRDAAQFARPNSPSSWMYDKQGLRLSLDGLGPGYAFEMNTLRSPLELFIGDEAAARRRRRRIGSGEIDRQPRLAGRPTQRG